MAGVNFALWLVSVAALCLIILAGMTWIEGAWGPDGWGDDDLP